MKSTPMLYQGEMVRAILREIERPGTGKTQTRRIVKPSPIPTSDLASEQMEDRELRGWDTMGSDLWFPPCPYGQPGDLIWVRESHYVWSAGYMDGAGKHIDYRSTEPDSPCGGWTPSIHMPRWASRITLMVTDVRVERVQDISEDDARLEGAVRAYPTHEGYSLQSDHGTYRGGFSALWDHINSKPKPVKVDGEIVYYESFPWEAINETREHRGLPWYVHGNPWVWTISFRPILANVDDVLADPARYGIEREAVNAV